MGNAVVSEMKVERKDLNPSTVQLAIECSEEQIKAGFDRALRELSKKVKIPGFRPGKAPKAMVEEAVNPQALYENAAENIVRKAYETAAENEKLQPEGQPSVDITEFYRGGEKLEDGKIADVSFKFTVKVPLAPVVELGEIKGLKAMQPPVDVTDEEISHQIDELRRGQGKKSEVSDRGIQEGDAVVLSLTVNDDEASRSFMVIAGQTFPDLDKAMLGLATDDVKAATLNFPENFQHEAWKGQKLKAKISIKSVSAFQLPELDDEFAKGYNFDNIDALKERVRDGITQVKNNAVRDMMRDQLLDAVLESSTVHVADNTWESVVDRRIREMGQELQSRGTTFEAYFKANEVTEEEFMDQLKNDAELNVRRAVVIQKLFVDHKMTYDQGDVNVIYQQVLAENNVPQDQVESFTKQYGAQIREEVIFRAMTNKVTDLLIENAQITVGMPGEGAEKKKKPAAKGEKAEAKPSKTTKDATKKAPKK
jgi:trigger factor